MQVKAMGTYSAVAGHDCEKYKYLALLIYVFKHLKLHFYFRAKKKKNCEGSQRARVYLQKKKAASIDLLFFSQIRAKIITFFLKGKKRTEEKRSLPLCLLRENKV